MKALLVLIATAAFLVAPAVTPPFTGYAPGLFPVEIARPFIQPAGYAFSIWGVIYLWLAAHAVLGLRRRSDPAWDRVRPSHILAVVLGAVWLAIAGGWPITATLAILVMAAAGITSFLGADPGHERWWVQAPMGLFAGWLTAASAVSTGVVLAGYGWLSNTGSAVLMLALVLVVAIAVQTRRPAMPTYSASVVWAIIGVAAVNWNEAQGLALLALAGAAVQAGVALACLAPANFLRKFRRA